MENPVDHRLDLGLVNYVQHPDNQNYVVYRFVDPNRAASFEKSLKEQNIWFEKGEEEKRNKNYILFGIHKSDYKKSEMINYLVEAGHKKKLISVAWLRYLILILSTVAMTLALIGYCKAQNNLEAANRQVEQN